MENESKHLFVHRIATHTFLFCLAFLGTQGPYSPFNGHEVIILLSSLSLAMLVWGFVLFCQVKGLKISLTSLGCALLLLYIWLALGYSYSIDPDNSFPIMVQYVGAACLYLALSFQFRTAHDLAPLLWVLTIYAGIMAFLGIIQQFNFSFFSVPPTSIRGSTSLFLHKNMLATYILFYLPVVSYLFLKTRSNRYRMVLWSIFVLLLISMWFTGSRAGQAVGIMEITGILGFLYWIGKKRDLKILAGGIAASIVLYQVLTYVLETSGIIQNRFSILTLASGEVGPGWMNLSNRVLIWKATWGMFKDYWLIGSGPWTYEAIFPIYLEKMEPGIILQNAPHPHNLIFTIATESGAIGLLLFSILLFLLYRSCHLVFWKSAESNRPLVFFLTLSITGFLIHNLVESNWAIASFVYHFTIWVFFLDFIAKRELGEGLKVIAIQGKVFKTAVFGFVLCAIFFIGTFYAYQQIMFRQIFTVQNLNELEEKVSTAQDLCPRCSFPGLALTSGILEEYKRTRKPELIARADSVIERVALSGTLNPTYLFYLARVRFYQGRIIEANEILSKIEKYDKLRKHINLLITPEQIVSPED